MAKGAKFLRAHELPADGCCYDAKADQLTSIKLDDLRAVKRVTDLTLSLPAIQEDTALLRNLGTTLIIKDETASPSGSFKYRGAAYLISRLNLTLSARLQKLVTATTGNHGYSLALFLSHYNHELTIVVPAGCTAEKITRLSRAGASVNVCGENLNEAIERAREISDEENRIFISSTSKDIILGYSSLGLDIFQELTEPDFIIFPLGTGAGLSGIAISRDMVSPRTRLIGVIPASCNSWAKSFKTGSIVPSVQSSLSICDALRTTCPNSEMFNFLRPRLHSVFVVPDKHVSNAQKICRERYGINAEPSAVAGLAAVIFGDVEMFRNSKVVIPICGKATEP